MGNLFDDDVQFLKQFNAKAQEKHKRKKQWLLTRQYLQPLNEPDDEDDDPSDKDKCSRANKKRFKSGYEAAKYGMREGLLTGVFFGGCWGILKHIGQNFNLSFLGITKIEDSSKRDRSQADFSSNQDPSWMFLTPSYSKNSIGREPSQSRHSMRSRASEPKDSPSYRENVSTYTKTVSVVRERSPEKTLYETNRLVYKFTNTKLPVRTDKRMSTARANAGIFDQNMYSFKRNRENVQIVGYAFIHTTGSAIEESGSGSIKSNESDGTKKSASKTNKEGKAQAAPSTSQTSSKRVESSNVVGKSESKKNQSSGTLGQMKSTSSTTKKSEQSGKSKADVRKAESHQVNVEPTRNATLSAVREKSGKLNTSKATIGTKEEAYLGSPCDSPDKRQSKVSENSGGSYTPHPKNVFERRRSSAAPSQRSRRGTDAFRSPAASENVYPDPKKIGSVLVNLKSVGNGFTSPPSTDIYEQSAGMSRAEVMSDSPDSVEPMSKTTVGGRSQMEAGRSVRYEMHSTSNYNQSQVFDENSHQSGSTHTLTRDDYISDSTHTQHRAENISKMSHNPTADRSNISQMNTADSRANMQGSRMLRSDYPDASYVPETPHHSQSQMASRSYISEPPQDSRSQMTAGSHISEMHNDSWSQMGSRSHMSEALDSRTNMPSSRMLRSEHSGAPMESRTNIHSSGVLRSEHSGPPMESRTNIHSSGVLGSDYSGAAMNSMTNLQSSGMLGSDHPGAPMDSRGNIHSSGVLRSEHSGAPMESRTNIHSSGVLRSEHSGPAMESRINIHSSGGLRSDHSGAPMDSRANMQSSRMLRSDHPGVPLENRGFVQGMAGLRPHIPVVPIVGIYSTDSRTSQNRAHYSDTATDRRHSGESGIVAKTSYIRESPEEMENRSYTAEELTRPSGTSKHSGYYSRVASSTVHHDSPSMQGVYYQDSGTRSYMGTSASTVGAKGGTTTEEEEKSLGKKGGYGGLSFLSGINENIIVLSACNCAIVLGVLCSIICTTRASFT